MIVFTFFHHSVWIPLGPLALFSLDQEHGFSVYLYYQHLALIKEGYKCELGLLGLLLDRPEDEIHNKVRTQNIR